MHEEKGTTREDLLGLRRKVCDDLELAIAGHAPWSLLEPLAAAAGMLEALADVPSHELVIAVVRRTETALEACRRWQAEHGHKATA